MLKPGWILFASFIAVIGCTSTSNDKVSEERFIDRVVGLAIEIKNDHQIDLPAINDSLVTVLPEKSLLKLANVLERRGFKEIESGRGNYPPRGPRIVIKTFRKDDCECTVSKKYLFTTHDNVFETTEGISCTEVD